MEHSARSSRAPAEAEAPAGAGDSELLDETLSDQSLDMRFIWFEWPPAQTLERFANEFYVPLRPNVSIAVDTVPIANWHDAIFTEFAAQQTAFTLPILDSQFIGEAAVNRHIVDMTAWIHEQSGIDLNNYDPFMIATYGQYPQTRTGAFEPGAKLYGLPLLGDSMSTLYRKDLIGETPPATWEEMLGMAREIHDSSQDISGLGFHTAGTADSAAGTLNMILWLYGGELWDGCGQIEGILNDEKGLKAMDVIVNEMTPLAPPGSSDYFISEVNNAFAQGTIAFGFNWVAAVGGNLDPEQSTLGDTADELRDIVGFAQIPPQETDAVPIGGLGLHISSYASPELQAEALNFIKWFHQPETQLEWGAFGGFPSTLEALNSPDFLTEEKPYNQVFVDSIPAAQGLLEHA